MTGEPAGPGTMPAADELPVLDIDELLLEEVPVVADLSELHGDTGE